MYLKSISTTFSLCLRIESGMEYIPVVSDKLAFSNGNSCWSTYKILTTAKILISVWFIYIMLLFFSFSNSIKLLSDILAIIKITIISKKLFFSWIFYKKKKKNSSLDNNTVNRFSIENLDPRYRQKRSKISNSKFRQQILLSTKLKNGNSVLKFADCKILDRNSKYDTTLCSLLLQLIGPFLPSLYLILTLIYSKIALYFPFK